MRMDTSKHEAGSEIGLAFIYSTHSTHTYYGSMLSDCYYSRSLGYISEENKDTGPRGPYGLKGEDRQ